MSERTEDAVKKLKALSLEDAEDNRCPETIKGLRCPYDKSAGRNICSYHYRLKCQAEEREPRNILGRQVMDKSKELERKLKKLETYQEVTIKLNSLDALDQKIYNSMEKQVQALSEVQKNSNQNEGYAKLDEKVLGKSPGKKRTREDPPKGSSSDQSSDQDPESEFLKEEKRRKKAEEKEKFGRSVSDVLKQLDEMKLFMEKEFQKVNEAQQEQSDRLEDMDAEIKRLDKEKTNKRSKKTITRDQFIEALDKSKTPYDKKGVIDAFGDKENIPFNGFQDILTHCKINIPINNFKNTLKAVYGQTV